MADGLSSKASCLVFGADQRLAPALTTSFRAIPRAPVQRLKTRSQFQAVLAGAVIARTEHFVLHRNSLDAKVPLVGKDAKPAAATNSANELRQPTLFRIEDVWLGAMVPKRWAKRAVTRNAIRRQIYAVGSAFHAAFQPAALVVRVRREFDRNCFTSASSVALNASVRAELVSLLQAGASAR